MGGADLGEKGRGRFQVVVVTAQPSLFQQVRCPGGDHPQGGTEGEACLLLYKTEGLGDPGQLLLCEGLAAGDDGKAPRPHGLGFLGLVQDLLRFHKRIGLDLGLVMGGLGAEGAVLRAASGLGIDDGAELYPMAIVMISNPADAMEEEGDKIVFYTQKVLSRGGSYSSSVQGLSDASLDELLHGDDT